MTVVMIRLCRDRQTQAMFGAGNPRRALHIKSMRIVMALVVIALMALLCASLYYAYGIWTTLGAADLPGWIYGAMIGGVVFSLLVGGGLMALVFYSNRAGYDDRASHNDNS
jgi:cytochrome c-type biogenesis protein CcmH/NrfG